ncbi:MAG: HAD hydrolase-like protein [Candidatus Omnitrophica bacterium]|nr:HAD hydrolase-like protein [Candidatus Omnitrophota bacterium]
MAKIKVVMFDLGNVLIFFDHIRAVNKIVRYTGIKPQHIYGFFFGSCYADDFDKGLLTEQQFFCTAKDNLGLKGLNKEDFFAIWNDIFWENLSLTKIIKEIKKKFPKFFIISNINKAHFEYVSEKFPILHEADSLVLSYQEKIAKPDSRIYQIALERAGCLAQEAFYTDDRPEFITAAKELGFQAVLFCGPGPIIDYLFGSGQQK